MTTEKRPPKETSQMDLKKMMENSDKAELLEKLAEVLDTEGHRLVVITGIPNDAGTGLDMEISQSGFTYLFEELGYIQEGLDIAEHQCDPDEDDG